MILLPNINLDSDTALNELKNKPIFVEETYVTRLNVSRYTKLEVYNYSDYFDRNTSSTQLDFDIGMNRNSSEVTTWYNLAKNSYDLISKFKSRESFSIKVRIKNISHFSPKIVID